LTPDNILIEDGLQIKIINFEQSKLKYHERNLQKKDGASSFTAPECFRDEFSEKCDVWSIGVILYLLISGIDPFGGDDLAQRFKRSKSFVTSFTSKSWRGISDD
jgi:calcium-dependent protein kinase